MSLNIFENHNLEFEVSLIKLDRVYTADGSAFGGTITDKVVDTINIEQSDILDLEITETSISMGAQGSITLSNKFNILEQLKISTNSPNDLYIAINIKDIELDGSDINETDKVITVIGLVNSTIAGSKNIIENILIFNWEEAFVAAARKTNLNYFANEFSNNPNSPVIDDAPGVISGTVIELADRFYHNIYKLRSDDMLSIIEFPRPGEFPNVSHKFETTIGFSDSIYDALNQMLKETTVGPGGKVGRVPYFRFVNTLDSEGKVKRKLKFSAFITDEHIKLIKAVFEGVKKGDFNNVYIEKFSIGPDVDVSPLDPNITIYNKIEKYNITRPDVGKLRGKVWGDYQRNKTSSMDPAAVNSKLKLFSEIALDYLERDLGGLAVNVNIPLLDPNEIKVFDLSPNTLSTRRLADNAFIQQENLIANTVIKSFLTINETISFTSKGSVIRQPNKFIWIERDAALGEEAYHKLWYVNSVTHKFKDGKYTTDIIATKLFGDTTIAEIKAASKMRKGPVYTVIPGDRVLKPDVLKGRIHGNNPLEDERRRKNKVFLEQLEAAEGSTDLLDKVVPRSKGEGGELDDATKRYLGIPIDTDSEEQTPSKSLTEREMIKAFIEHNEANPQYIDELANNNSKDDSDKNILIDSFLPGDVTGFKKLSQEEIDFLVKTAEEKQVARDNRRAVAPSGFNPDNVTF